LTYAVDGLRDIMLSGESLIDVWLELVVLAAFAAVTSILAAITLRKSV